MTLGVHSGVPQRRLAAASGLLLGVGGLAALAARGLLHTQAGQARKAIGKPLGEQAFVLGKTYRPALGDPLVLAVLGDSIAAGLGADRPRHTLGVRLAKKLATSAGRSVELVSVAEVGAESSRLADQLARLPADLHVDVAIVVVGGNDVTHRVRVQDAVADLGTTVRALRDRGAQVVVGTCPDLGALRPLPQPLRSLARQASRRLAQAQRDRVVREGGYAVSLTDVVGPFFVSQPDAMFAVDRFHPSSAGYRRTAEAMLPSVLAGLGLAEQVPTGHHAPVIAPV